MTPTASFALALLLVIVAVVGLAVGSILIDRGLLPDSAAWWIAGGLVTLCGAALCLIVRALP